MSNFKNLLLEFICGMCILVSLSMLYASWVLIDMYLLDGSLLGLMMPLYLAFYVCPVFAIFGIGRIATTILSKKKSKNSNGVKAYLESHL